MKYFSRSLQNGLYDLVKDLPTIQEIYVPLISSRDQDLHDFCAKKGFTIDKQILLGANPPIVRVLRKLIPGPMKDVPAMEKELSSYCKTLKGYNLGPDKVYVAAITPNLVETLTRSRDAYRYYHGIGWIETILSVECNDFKEIVDMDLSNKLGRSYSPIQVLPFKNQSDSKNIHRISFRYSYNSHGPDRNVEHAEMLYSTLGNIKKLQSAPQEHRLVLANYQF